MFRVLPLQDSRISRRSFVLRSPLARSVSDPTCGAPTGPTAGRGGAAGGGGAATTGFGGGGAAVNVIAIISMAPAFSVTSRSNAVIASPEKRRRYVPARSPGKLV